MDLLSIAQHRIAGLKQKTAKEWAGPCPECGGTDRFIVWTEKEGWHCRGCNKSGDAIEFLRQFEGKTCPEAHAALGRDCRSHACPVADKCRKGSGTPAAPRTVTPPAPKDESYQPAAATDPQSVWTAQAAALIDKAHQALLASADQLDYLARRGLPLEAVQLFRLGWLPENRYPARSAWGLPGQRKEDGTLKKMFIPSGILIPFFDVAGDPHRVRIRRNDIDPDDARYYWLQGSGDDVPVLGPKNAKAIVVIESDLDALMVLWQCRDLSVATVPLGTCSAKPKQTAMQQLRAAHAILVAHDYEPRHNPTTGKAENPGGQGARWWLKNFETASRWPVPAGKDPGEYYQDHGGDVRAWVLAGLPPSFHVRKPAPAAPAAPTEPKEEELPTHAQGETVNGHLYVVAYQAADVPALAAHYPDHVVFAPHEIAALKGMSKAEAEQVLIAKKVMQGTVQGTREVGHE